MDSSRLLAFTVICDTGSFEKAAAHLHITPSAISQRITTLEREVGQVLVRRARPAQPTAAGLILLGYARQNALLLADTLKSLSPDASTHGEHLRMSLAINADSISTWFRPALASIAEAGRFLLDLHVEDQDHTATLLTEGRVMAAVTTDPKPAPGCRVAPLGGMTYWTACAPQLLRDHRVDDVDLSTLPMLRYDVKDDLQHAMLRRLGILAEPPTHFVPSNHEYLTAARLGLGWGVLPKDQIDDDIASGRLIRLLPRETVTVALFWQRWRIESDALDELSDNVFRAARAHLNEPT